MALDYAAEPRRNGRLDARPDRQAPGNAARAGQTAQPYRHTAGPDHSLAGGDGEGEYVIADHLEYWHKLQPSATVADAAISDQRGIAGGKLHGSGGDGIDKSFRRYPVAWSFLGLAVAILFGHLMLQIGAATKDDQAVIVIEQSQPDFFASKPPIWNGVSGR